MYAYVGTVSLFVMLLEFGWSDACTRKLAAIRNSSVPEETRRVRDVNFGVNLVLAASGMAIMVLLGAFLTIPEGHLDRSGTLLVMAMGGVNLVAYYVRNRYAILMKVEERFDLAATYDFASSVGGVAASIGLLMVWPHPASLVLGGAFMWIISGALGWWWYRRSGLSKDHPRIQSRVIADVAPVAIKEFPSKLANMAGNSADRLLVGSTLGASAMTDLNVSGRVAEALEGILQPLIWNALPRLSHTYHHEPDKFHEVSARYTRLCLAVAIAAILIPSACSGAFLRIWLGAKAPEAGAEILLGMGIYRACIFLAFAYRTVFFAAGNPQWFTVFTAYNAILTVSLTIPFVQGFGLAGVGAMNAVIAISTMLFLPTVVRRALGRDSVNWPETLRLFASFFGGIAVALPLYYITNHTVMAKHNFWCMGLGMVWAIAVFLLWIRLRLAELPGSARDAIQTRAKLRMLRRILRI